MGDDALALDVRCHAQELADGDHAGAAHTGHHQAPYAVNRGGQVGDSGFWNVVVLAWRCQRRRFFLAQAAAFDGHKTRAKAFDAGDVFVTRALVDLALAAKVGFQRFDADAIALCAAVAAAFADQLVNHHAHRRVDQRAALAAAAFFGGAGLVVNDDGGALDLPEFALYAVEFVAVLHVHAVGQAFGASVFVRLVGDHHDALGAFGAHALGDLDHAVALGPLAHLLAAGHGHRVVVQNLVGNVHARCNRLAHRQQAAVEIGAVTQVGEYVLVVGKGLLADPGHALTAHLGEARGGAVHPNAHEMAANAGHGARALGHLGAGVVRAT